MDWSISSGKNDTKKRLFCAKTQKLQNLNPNGIRLRKYHPENVLEDKYQEAQWQIDIFL